MPQSVFGGIVYAQLHGGNRDMFVLTSWVMISGTVNDTQHLTDITVVGASMISVTMYSSYGGGSREAGSIIRDNYAPTVSPGAKEVNWFYTYNLTGYGIYTDGYSGSGWFNYVAPPTTNYEST